MKNVIVPETRYDLDSSDFQALDWASMTELLVLARTWADRAVEEERTDLDLEPFEVPGEWRCLNNPNV